MYGKLPIHIPRIGSHSLIKLLPFQEKCSPLVQCKGTRLIYTWIHYTLSSNLLGRVHISVLEVFIL